MEKKHQSRKTRKAFLGVLRDTQRCGIFPPLTLRRVMGVWSGGVAWSKPGGSSSMKDPPDTLAIHHPSREFKFGGEMKQYLTLSQVLLKIRDNRVRSYWPGRVAEDCLVLFAFSLRSNLHWAASNFRWRRQAGKDQTLPSFQPLNCRSQSIRQTFRYLV